MVLVKDVRHPLTEFDWQMVEWCQHTQLPLHVILTKADKLNFGAAKTTMLEVQRELSVLPSPLTLQLFSSLKKTGIDEIHAALNRLFTMRQHTNDPI
jgi:GTP-binding protein